tara:strand:- start:346 stop:1512 length:1167 start_codon:yes stop_codon:yes gene_type:complete
MIKKLSIIFFSIFFSFIIIETYFQIIERTNLWKIFNTIKPILGEPDYQMGFKFTPSTNKIWLKENKNRIKINKYGIHDHEIKDVKNRIVITGNSMIEALQVELDKNFENITEKNLNQFANIQINNLAMSGHGPLRQLIMLENYGYDLKPNLVIMFLPITEFVNNELTNDSYNPAYKLFDNKVIRSYSFRERYQIKMRDNYLMDKLLFLIREFSTLRMFYFMSKQNIYETLGIKKDIENTKINLEKSCPSNKIKSLENLFLKKIDKNKVKIADGFFNDLHNSIKNNRTKAILFITGLSYFNKCDKDNEISNLIINNLNNNYSNKYLKFYDFENLLFNYLKKISKKETSILRKEMYGFKNNIGNGHLNYSGHFIYSQILTDIIKKNFQYE